MKRHDNRGAASGTRPQKMPLYANDASKFVKKANSVFSHMLAKKPVNW